jgi:UPF0271 protein
VRAIDINADCGESFGNWTMGDDEALIPLITSANVACGYHAGDPLTMRATVRHCVANGVAVGSHPGFPDLLGFGRRAVQITPEDAYGYVVYQSGALQAFLAAEGASLHHVKAHGAFYTVLREDDDLAEAYCEAVEAVMPEPLIYWPDPTDCSLPRLARKRGLRVVLEIYPDLDYSPEGMLILQRAKHHRDVEQATGQVRRWIETGEVEALDGSTIPVDGESICVHGDGPNVIEITQAIRGVIEESGNEVGQPVI